MELAQEFNQNIEDLARFLLIDELCEPGDAPNFNYSPSNQIRN